jgi:ABC-type transport system involved in cytochrome c biogenesis permease subunit
MERIQTWCFLFSYASALGLELLHHFRPRPVLRYLAIGCGAAGLLAHTLYLAGKRPPLAWPFGWLLLLAWVLAIFYLYGALHHRRLAWGVFVLPLVLGLVGLGVTLGELDGRGDGAAPRDEHLWALLHAGLLLLATVGVCVAFVASLMYLIQSHRLKAKLPPGKGLRLLSLERLEAMNRRALTWTFPLLTAGVLLGAALMSQQPLDNWLDPRAVGAVVLWLAFAVLVYLRYGYHVRGRRVALLTILAFVLMICCLALSHPAGKGGLR